MDFDLELRRTQPDYIVYRPTGEHDTGNEHFLAFDGPDGRLMAVWTQSTHEGAGDHRVVMAISDDDGATWSEPGHVAGIKSPVEPDMDSQHESPTYQASWGFPLVSRSGRIYVVYNQYRGVKDYSPQVTGTMDCVYTDDLGLSWSEPQTIPMQRSPFDHPDPNVPSNWIVWQKPERLSGGKYYVGFTRWVSPAVREFPDTGMWKAESVCEFMRFENIDDDPEPRDIVVSWFAFGDQALRVGHYDEPLISVAQEPSVVTLPDGRLFCTMRTMTGYIWYSLSEDAGETWCNPRPLLRRDHGRPILHPISCCPIYSMPDGTYFLIHHGRLPGTRPDDSHINRRPAYLAVGEYRPDADQPIWFGDSIELMDNENQGIGPQKRVDCAVYTSVTHRSGESVLWYPDRKFFLLGKRLNEIVATAPRPPVAIA